MAIQPIGERLDELAAVTKSVDESQAQLNPIEPEPAEPVPYTTEQQEFEPVAGPLSIVRKALQKVKPKTEVPVLPAGQESGRVGSYQVIRDAEPAKAQQILQQAPGMPASGKPSPTARQKAGGVEETAFNLDMIEGPDGLKQHIEATARAYGADKLERISYKDIAAKMADDGYDEAFIGRILDTQQKTIADPKEAYKMLLAVTDAGKRAFDLGEKVKAAQKAGTLTPELAVEFHQAIALEGVLLKSARGRQADIARSLGIFSQARRTTAQRGQMLEAVLNEAGGIENAFELAARYTALDTKGARAALSEKTIGGTLKDIWFSTWINGLLSSPITHAKNIAGNTFFGAWQIPERAAASVIGKTRNLLFKGGEQAVGMNEVYAQAVGFLQGIREGGEIALTAFRKNEPTDPFSKIEMRAGGDPFAVDLGDSATGKALSDAMRYWGTFVTVPGRALMAEDEFFKAIGYRMELNALAAREANREYTRLIGAGIDDVSAAQQSQDMMVRLLTDPPPEIDEAARGMARTVTFTRELEPSLQGVQRLLQNPLLKMFVPFVRTPTNIALEAMARTPGLNFGSPRFWADYNAGGVKRDMAMARVTLGSGLIYGAGTYALDGKVTGYGPMRKGDKEALKGTGWQEFSLVFGKDDVDPELLSKFQELTSVSIGPDKVYVSYAGLEPLSTLLSIASTAGEYSMLAAGEADMGKLMMGGTLGIYQYLSDQPMLQGFGEINKVFTSGAKDAPTMLYNIMAQAAKQGASFAIGGSPAGAYSSLVANVERILYPERSNTMEAMSAEDINPLDGAVKGFWEAVSLYKSRNPMTSDSLPPLLDTITGEVRKVGKGNWSEMFNPFRKSDGTYAPAHAVLVEYGVPMYFPDKKIDGVELTAEQYNRWIEFATKDGALSDRIVALGRDRNMQRLAGRDLEAAQSLIAEEVSRSYEDAKKLLLIDDVDLAMAVEEAKETRKDAGMYKR